MVYASFFEYAYNDVNHLEALNALGWEILEAQRMKLKANQMYKVLHGVAPTCLADIFIEITDHDLRGCHTSLHLPLPRTENLKKSFSYSRAKVWNSLPSTIRELESFPIF